MTISDARAKVFVMASKSSTRSWVKKLRFRPKCARHVWCSVGALCLASVTVCGALMAFLDSYGQTDRAQKAQAIVVLGSRVKADGQAGNSLRRRALQAAALYQRGLAPFVICTGGVGQNAPAESKVAAQILGAQGLPPSAILTEESSTSTWENAQQTAQICRERGWTRVIIVSEPYHLWRARRNFADVGLTAFPSPAQNPSALWRVRAAARECLSVVRDVLVGH